MATNTFVALDKVTVGVNTPSITFSSIPATYTDLVIVANVASSSSNTLFIRFNNDSSAIYSATRLSGPGTSPAVSDRDSGAGYGVCSNYAYPSSTLGATNHIINIMNYANTSITKNYLVKSNSASAGVDVIGGLYRSTSAINTISISTNGFGGTSTILAGSTFSLYGIKKWVDETTPKATGGLVTSDSNYWYHTFDSSSTFAPNQTLSCEYLVVGGGGGGGGIIGGGGGAGGYRTFSGSISSGSYPVVIGAGGMGGIYGGISGTIKLAPSSGNASTFNGYSSAGGGSGAYFADGSFYGPATSGGSGGGGSRNQGAGSGNTPSTSPVQGYSGGTGQGGAPYYNAGGGGGAGGAGSNASTSSGNGGPGLNWLSLGTYYAGGGGAARGDAGGDGTGGIGGGGNGVAGIGGSGSYATGGGGGGGHNRGGAGGGGVVIIRYAK